MSSRPSAMAVALIHGEEKALRALSEKATRKFLKDLQRAGVRRPANVKLRAGIPQMIVPGASSPCGSPAALCAE